MPTKCRTANATTLATAAKAEGTTNLNKRGLLGRTLTWLSSGAEASSIRPRHLIFGLSTGSSACVDCLINRAVARIVVAGMCSGSLLGGRVAISAGGVSCATGGVTGRAAATGKGAVMLLLQLGQGPLTPAMAAGT
jgi:hypothetical protein